MHWLGFIKDDHYLVGHAAFLLINHTSGEVKYFDFGRYHTPVKHGRVRDEITDWELHIAESAIIRNGEILNLKDILIKLSNYKPTHGDGRMTASLIRTIDYDNAYSRAKYYQSHESLPYGPFQFRGSNCSRFVGQVVVASNPGLLTKLMLWFPYTISATPRSNNKVLNEYAYYYEVNNGQVELRRSKFFGFRRMFLEGDELMQTELKGEQEIDKIEAQEVEL